jgi:hypothetical protein
LTVKKSFFFDAFHARSSFFFPLFFCFTNHLSLFTPTGAYLLLCHWFLSNNSRFDSRTFDWLTTLTFLQDPILFCFLLWYHGRVSVWANDQSNHSRLTWLVFSSVTVAPHITENNSDSFLASFNASSTPLDNDSTVLDNLLPSTQGWPMEDLTGEVHDLMLR